MSNWYYTSIFLRKNQGKIKVDICTVPCRKSEEKFESLAAKEYFELSFHPLFKKWMKYSKEKNEYFIQIVSEENDFSLAEKENISFAKKYLGWKLLFLPKYREALKTKIEKIH